MTDQSQVAYLVGLIGKDTDGIISTSFLAAQGIDVTFLQRHRTRPTGHVITYQDDNSGHIFDVTPGSSANFDSNPTRINRFFDQKGADIDAAYLTLEAPLAVARRIVKRASALDIPVFCDAGGMYDTPQAYLPLLKYMTTIAPNEKEAFRLTDEDVASIQGVRRAADKLLLYGHHYTRQTRSLL
jgi:sugar/nucleoside kinase (ribokinase family)